MGNLSDDLRKDFPGANGFSAANLWRMKNFYEAYGKDERLAQLVREIGWSHNIAILESVRPRRIPDDLCVAPRFLANPSHVLRTWNAIGAIDPEFFRPFAKARRMTLDTALLRPALDFGIRLTESGVQQNPERTPVRLTDQIYRQLEGGIPSEVASFLVELARVQPGRLCTGHGTTMAN